MFKFGILTVSTTNSVKPQNDPAEPSLERSLLQAFPQSSVVYKNIVSDDKILIKKCLEDVSDAGTCDVLFTVGETGLTPSDVTPDAAKAALNVSGLVHAIISRNLGVADMAVLPRPVCGIRNKTIILNFPGNAKAAVERFSFVQKALPRVIALLEDVADVVKSDQEQIRKEQYSESKVEIVGSNRNLQYMSPFSEADAKQIILQTLIPCEETETISIGNALNRILGEYVWARKPVPAFPVSTKDGYAVRTEDGVGNRMVRNATAAGDKPEPHGLQRDEIIRISSGATVPDGADAVVQIEDTELIQSSDNGQDELIVNILVRPKVAQNIREVGSDIKEGTRMVEKYSKITAASICVIAMLGLNKVKVIKRPSVGIISIGNELLNPKEPLKPGQIHDSNKVTLLYLLKSYGYVASDCGIARRTPNSVKSTLEKAFEQTDFIITSGGVSMREFDLLKRVLIEDFGAVIHFDMVNLKPGEPTVFATFIYNGARKVIFSLSGNPVPCCVTSLLFVLPALKYMERNKLWTDWPRLSVELGPELRNDDQRPEYIPATVTNTYSYFSLISTGNQISSKLNSMVNANALLYVPEHTVLKNNAKALLFGELY